MMKILIAYDGSVDADGALHDLVLAGLPAEADARVISFAMPMLPYGPETWVPGVLPAEYARVADEVVKDTRLVAERAAAYLCEHFPHWKVKAESGLGSPAEGILAKAEAWKPDLLVVGSHGRTALGRLLLGSVSLNVLHHAPATVRITRPRLRSKEGPPRIVVAVDGSRGSDAVVSAVVARDWPRRTEARVVGVFENRGDSIAVLDKSRQGSQREISKLRKAWIEKRMEAAAKRLAAAGLDVTQVLLSGDPRDALVLEAKAWAADCIHIGSRGLGALGRFLLGSVSSAVASHASCSVEVDRARPSRRAPRTVKTRKAKTPKGRTKA